MFEDHERAARMPNAPNVPWHSFLASRFVGSLDGRAGNASIAIEIQAVTHQSGLHAELRGLLEYGAGLSLPLVFEIVGTLDLETREVRIGDAQGSCSERSYSGYFSENGRVLTLRLRTPGKPSAKQLQLVEEATRQELHCE
jgi:hypothetical protein